MIDFNSDTYVNNKPLVTKEELLKHITEFDIIETYFKDIPLNTTICSPVREDKHPSFNIFYSASNSCFMFKDFSRKDSGDLIVLVEQKYNLNNYQHALEKIAYDFSLNNYFSFIYDRFIFTKAEYSKNSSKINKPDYKLQIRIREWTRPDIQYWQGYGVSLETLNKYNVVAISSYFANGFEVFTPGLAYAYIENKDNQLTYKIYRPFEDKAKKWRTDHAYSVHQGYIQLPSKGSLLVITKSLKDVMSLYDVAKIYSIGIQAENSKIKDTVILEYKQRFNQVFTLFDNDITGRDLGRFYQKEYNIPPFFIPKEYNCKDFSDLVLEYGKEVSKKIIYNLLKLT